MSTIPRAFVAVVPPPAVLDVVESLVESARRPGDGLRWARRDQWHVTLQFLGRVDESDSLAESLTESVRRRTPFAVQLGGAGAFPSPKRGSVLWLGPTVGGPELGDLARAVHAATDPLGFAGEDRPFRPHFTLARAPRPHDLSGLIAALADGPAGPPWTVDHVSLIASDTRPDGAVYTERARFSLDG